MPELNMTAQFTCVCYRIRLLWLFALSKRTTGHYEVQLMCKIIHLIILHYCESPYRLRMKEVLSSTLQFFFPSEVFKTSLNWSFWARLGLDSNDIQTTAPEGHFHTLESTAVKLFFPTHLFCFIFNYPILLRGWELMHTSTLYASKYMLNSITK